MPCCRDEEDRWVISKVDFALPFLWREHFELQESRLVSDMQKKTQFRAHLIIPLVAKRAFVDKVRIFNVWTPLEAAGRGIGR